MTVTGGTATPGTDFFAVTGFEIAIPANRTEAVGSFGFTPKNDDVDEGTGETVTVGGTAPGLEVRPATLSLTDDDLRGIEVAPDPLTVPENGAASYGVRLNSAPVGGDVTVRVTGMSGSDLTVTGPDNADLGAGGVLSFTAENWETEQLVTVAAGPDDDAADDMATLTHRASGADYGAAPRQALAVTVLDADTAALVLSETALDVQEQGPAVELTLRLASAPVDPVTVTVTGHDGTDLRVSPASHGFSASDWNTDKAFRVSAVADPDSQDDEPVRLTLTPAGSAEYAALGAGAVDVTLTDDDAPGLKLSASKLDVPEGRSRSFTVRLFGPLLRAFAQRHGLDVLAVSLTGGPLEGWPEAVPDKGRAARLGLAGTPVPAVVLFDTKTKKVLPVGFGVMAEDQLAQRIFTLTALEPGHDY